MSYQNAREAELRRLFLPRTSIGLPALALLTAALYYLSRTNYLLFHALVELFSIAVACGVFMIAWHSRRHRENGFFLCLGVGSFFVGIVDFFHILAYKGMGVFPSADANLPTQLWIVARYLQAASILSALYFLRRKAQAAALFWGFFAAAALLLALVFGGLFPDCLRPGTGLTPFKIGSEYLVCLLLAASLVYLRRHSESLGPGVGRLLSAALAAFIAAELAFTLYSDVYGFFNMAGHLFKIAGFYFLYRGVIETGLTRPLELLFWDLKRSEEDLRQRSEELEESNTEYEAANTELAVSNDQLEAAVSELEAANHDLEAFNYSVTHDLRGPMTVIHGHADLLLTLHAGKVDPEVEDFIRTILGQTKRMDRILSTLLDFSRLKKAELRREQVDMGVLVLGVVADLEKADPSRRVHWALQDDLRLDADPNLLQVLLENLIGNAWKYTGKETEARIEVGSIASETGPAFFVRDNGIGFDPAGAEDLFTPFQRLHEGGEFEGTGIGLATVKRIVDRHGGRIWAESSPGEGSTFFFTLSERNTAAAARADEDLSVTAVSA